MEAKRKFPLESLLSARKLLVPQLVGDRVYFISDMSGMFSLYAMDRGGSIPEPLLPRGLALQNPHLMAGDSFRAVPTLKKVLVQIDQDGNENYQPCFVPETGGVPEPVFGERYEGQQLMLVAFDEKTSIAYFNIDDRKTPDRETIQVDLKDLKIKSLGKSIYGNFPAGHSEDHQKLILADTYLANDLAGFIWESDAADRRLLFGTPIDQRKEGEEYPLLGISLPVHFIRNDRALIFKTTLHDDLGGIGFLDIKDPEEIHPVPIHGLKHKGMGELDEIEHVHNDIYLLHYNIDGCSWWYEAKLDDSEVLPKLHITHILVGQPPLNDGVTLVQDAGVNWSVDESKSPPSIEYVTAFTRANSPSQLYLINPRSETQKYVRISNERILGIDDKFLSPGEDASFTSSDGLRISARLYLPAEPLGYEPPYPLVLYVHGGPQSQEKPDFTWFSMPLIQYLTLNGFAIFVPNVRGSRGYGQKFMKMVDHDWGGNDTRDHVEGLKMLEKDPRIDSARRAVTGRSYGGYMTLWLVARYPELWKAGCDMFGPYNLVTFVQRLPETWKTYFYLTIGHPEKDREFLLERSPATYFEQVRAPLLVVQGKNDPRVIEAESADVVAKLRKQGTEVEYLMFEDEGHDVNKFKNQVKAYTKIVEFFKRHLKP
ncbi:MAG: prolyl oligopeptidase family serine peptidase [Promethearchaeota archaeon]